MNWNDWNEESNGAEQNGEPLVIRMEDIRPNMSEDDRQKALDEILRVLRGGE